MCWMVRKLITCRHASPVLLCSLFSKLFTQQSMKLRAINKYVLYFDDPECVTLGKVYHEGVCSKTVIFSS